MKWTLKWTFHKMKSCDGQNFSWFRKKSGPYHHNKLWIMFKFDFRVPIYAGLQSVVTKNKFSGSTFFLIKSTLFSTQVFQSFEVCLIHQIAICESDQQNIFETFTSYSIAFLTEVVKFDNNKHDNNSRRGMDKTLINIPVVFFDA